MPGHFSRFAAEGLKADFVSKRRALRLVLGTAAFGDQVSRRLAKAGRGMGKPAL